MLTKFHVMTMLFLADLKEKQSERGATAVEYGLLVALIAAVIIATVITLGGQINAAFQDVVDSLTGAGVTAPTGT